MSGGIQIRMLAFQSKCNCARFRLLSVVCKSVTNLTDKNKNMLQEVGFSVALPNVFEN